MSANRLLDEMDEQIERIEKLRDDLMEQIARLKEIRDGIANQSASPFRSVIEEPKSQYLRIAEFLLRKEKQTENSEGHRQGGWCIAFLALPGASSHPQGMFRVNPVTWLHQNEAVVTY